MRRLAIWVAMAALLAALVQVCLAADAPAQVQPQTFMVEMRDGVKLATDVYLPEGEGPWPVVLTRTPYNKTALGPGMSGMAKQGYAVVVQDVRGRYASEGEPIPFMDDGWGPHQDGYDTAAWIVKQPWCDGKIGTVGGSAMGITQYLLVGTEPPGLVCEDVIVGAPSLYHDAVWPGGVYREAMIDGWVKATNYGDKALAMLRDNPCYAGPWKDINLLERLKQMRKVPPAVHIGGWFDIFSKGTTDAFVGMRAKSREQWLVMGPWTHGVGKSKAGDLEFPKNAAELPRIAKQGDWLAHWLKGTDNGIEKEAAVHYYVMGACGEEGAPGNEWRTAEAWPVPAAEQHWYLRAGGVLRTWTPGDEPPGEYRHDPDKPVPTIGGNNLLIPAGPKDQREAENRPDVLRFTSSVLDEPLEVTGSVVVRLWVSSTATHADFMAKLCDVYPDGRSMLVMDAAKRVSPCSAQGEVQPIQPGKVYKIAIELGPTSIIFNKGHRIRVDIASSNSPRFAVCPQAAEQTVFHDRKHPSAVVLPVVVGSSK